MRWAMGLAAALFVSACAGIPESGPVVPVIAASSRTHSAVRYEPARPRPGASPQAIAEGYLDAMLAYPEATAIVESFLTPRAAEDWDSGSGMTVYSSAEPRLRALSGDRAQVSVRLHEVMSLDPSGRATLTPREITRVLQLARVAGQWRIDNPVPGYLAGQNFARDYLRTYPLWYFDESGEQLVPELVHAVVSEQLPVTLLHLLAEGPRGSTLRTFLPTLEGLKVRVSGDTADIDIRRPKDGTEDKVAAQLLSTLRGVPGIDRVRILMNGRQLGAVHRIDAIIYTGLGPQPVRVYGLRKNRVVSVSTEVKPMAGPWGRSARGAVDIGVGADAVAAVQAGRTEVVVGGRKGGKVTSYQGTGFARPSWDDSGRLWLVDHPASTRVRVVDGAATVGVDAGDLGAVASFAVSPEGSRYAAVVGAGRDARVVVGDIVHDAAGFPRRLGEPRLVSRGLTGERQVGWASQTRVEFIAGTASTPQLYSVGLDGVDLSASTGAAALAGGVTAWAGPPADGAARWAIDRRGRVWMRAPGGSWRHVTTTAGGVVRGLSSGR